MTRRSSVLIGVLSATIALLPGVTAPAAAQRAPAPVTAVVDPALAGTTGDVSVVVVRRPGTGDLADRTVRALGGAVTKDLPIIRGFAARLGAADVAALAGSGGAATVSLDRAMTVQSSATAGTGPNSVYAKALGAESLHRTGVRGGGVTVALLDTGIADLPDLAGRVLPVRTDPLGTQTAPCVNLSGESGCDDSYGHGTFLAGLIAGNGAASGGEHVGVAPQANLVSIKVAGRTGAADVSTVIAGIQWAVSFKNEYGIRVLNLSLGTDSTQSYRVDPLNYAVERAWAAGIVVVVSASNRGPAAGTISKPGDDPFVLTVGAVDDRGTAGIGDDRLPLFSSRGPTAADGLAKPDVVAPGARLVSLSAPGSAIATEFPSPMAAPYRRGSGTSMATAVTSGAVALMLSAQPALTPDRVKYAFAATARPVASTDRMAVGSGMVDVVRAFSAPPGVANAGVQRSSGLGSLDASRGTSYVQLDDPMSTVVTGEMTAQLLLWDPLGYTTGEWTGANWYGANWYGANWYGANWYGANWYGANWYGANWYGSEYYGEVDGANWYGANWYGANWYGAWE
ncbi:MAG TPA: S8 family serine peptidase [Frankiaceae bacterium]|nr:S8 family serine peptidase [Frankiaceae bacterium]